jgi:hypothetical protein
MSNSTVTYREIRFLIEDDLPQAYVLCEAGGDSPIGAQGWHHKTYPANKSVADILDVMFTKDDPVLWGQEAPPR